MRAVLNCTTHLPVLCSVSAYPTTLYQRLERLEITFIKFLCLEHSERNEAYYDGADGIAIIKTLDAPLVSPGERRLLQFDNTFAPLDGGMHFVLYNNLWGTNFPMWYEENAKFRFSLTLQNSSVRFRK